MIKTLNNIQIEISKGDIAVQPGLDAVVNAANSMLAPGGGVAGAIHSKAGPDLYKECKDLAPILPGEAVITKAFGLPNKYIIHCLGPVYGKDIPGDKFLAACYQNSINLADKHKLQSIGFPAISTGIFGYPPLEAIDVVFNTVLGVLPRIQHLKKIKFVLFSDEDFNLYKSKLAQISPG
ncbi:macro domain-containing protein [Christiangramia sabulilitoris]|uniref:Macro domain-containing protein n=1 Tax=Christiangramia sabulilitoris TaxID=2583991 RepID=A0A550I8I4_9FLAO|nr:macro domain-containing protein [Christiangramia sabulilitoris]TRO67279.1 macro domain-containing protein [Christiangramia sabulilitoris]